MRAATIITAGLLTSLMTTGTAMAESFVAEKNNYVITKDGSFMGNAETAMNVDAAAGSNCYHAVRTAIPKRSLRWLSGDAVEETKFCVNDGTVVPTFYRYERSGAGSSNENFTLDFDFAAGQAKATGKKGRDRAISAGVYDKYSVEYGLRLWARAQRRANALDKGQQLELRYADKKSNKTYQFTVGDEEQVDTPFGMINTRRFDAATKKGRTTFWLDLENDFRLVMFEREKKGTVYKMVTAPKGYKPK